VLWDPVGGEAFEDGGVGLGVAWCGKCWRKDWKTSQRRGEIRSGEQEQPYIYAFDLMHDLDLDLFFYESIDLD